MSCLQLAVAGASGRMGQAILRLAAEDAEVEVVHALVRPGSAAVGRPRSDGAGVYHSVDTARLAAVDVLVDFALPGALEHVLARVSEWKSALVVGGTGHAPAQIEHLTRLAAAGCCVVRDRNMSLGVQVLGLLVERAAALLGPEFDYEMFEQHHRNKVDAPSGTALLLLEALRQGAPHVEETPVMGRSGVGAPRRNGEVGVLSSRGGQVPGDHTVFCLGEEERLELTHRALSRDVFARGALRAARWAAGAAPGTYTMRDVLGTRTAGK